MGKYYIVCLSDPDERDLSITFDPNSTGHTTIIKIIPTKPKTVDLNIILN